MAEASPWEIADDAELIVAPSLNVEQSDAQSVTIYLGAVGTRLRVPRKLYELLIAFETPRDPGSVTADDARMASALDRLREKGFLVAPGAAAKHAPQRLVTDPPIRLFDCPAHKLSPSDTDIVVLGVPYDLGDPAAAGARQGPSALRETSLQLLYGMDRRTARPHGWYDADLGRPILQGVTIGDCGDVFVDPGEPQAAMFARISEILGRVAGEGSLPVLLGGDAATGFPAIEFLQERSELAVIWIGNPLLPGRLPGVRPYAHIGAGGAVPRHLDPGERVYVGLDLAALESGFTYAQLHELLLGIGERYAIAGLSLVGARPQEEGWGATAMTAIHLLLTGLSAAKDQLGTLAK